MKKRLLLLCVFSIGMVSCDRNYDFTTLKGQSIDIGANLRIPLNGDYKMTIKDLMKDASNENIDTLTREWLEAYPALAKEGWRVGDYYVHANTSKQSQNVSISAINPISKSLDGNPINIEISAIPVPVKPETDIMLDFTSDGNVVDISGVDVPDVVTEIKKLKGNGEFTMMFEIPDLKVVKTICLQGRADASGIPHTSPSPVTINLPKWLDLGEIQCSPAAEFKKSGNTIILEKDVKVSSKSTFTVTAHLNGVNFKDADEKAIEGAHFDAAAHKVSLYDVINVTGKLIIGKDDIMVPCPAVSEQIKFKGQMKDFTVTEVQVKIAPDLSGFTVKPFTIDKSKLPDFLTGANSVLDLAGLFALTVNVDNPLPVGLYVKTDIESINESASDPYRNVRMNFDRFTFRPGCRFEDDFLQIRNMYDTENKTAEGKPVSFFHTLPDMLKTIDFSVNVDKDSWADIRLGNTYLLNMQCWFTTVLAFGSELSIDYTYDVTDISMDLGKTGTSEVLLHSNIANTIPLNVEVTPVILKNVAGKLQPIEGVAPIDPVIIESGNLECAKEKEVDFIIRMEDSDKVINSFDGLRLEMKLRSVPANVSVEAINAKSSVIFNDTYVTTSQGVEIKL